MEAFIEQLLKSHRVDALHVTIVDDNASPTMPSKRLSNRFKRRMNSCSNNNTSSQSRWLGISDNSNDLSNEKINISGLRRMKPSQSLAPGGMPKQKYDGGVDRVKARRSSSDIIQRQPLSCDRDHNFHSSFPSAHLTRVPIKKREAGNENGMLEKLDEIESEHSINVLEAILEDSTHNKDHYNRDRSNEKFFYSLDRKGFGSSAEITDTTYDMDDSYQSIFEYNTHVSNEHTSKNQAPKAPQRKISQDKLQSLDMFLSYNSSFAKISDTSNASFDVAVVTTPKQRRRNFQGASHNMDSFSRTKNKVQKASNKTEVSTKKGIKTKKMNKNKKESLSDPTKKYKHLRKEAPSPTSLQSNLSITSNTTSTHTSGRSNHADGVQQRNHKVKRLRNMLGSMAPKAPLDKTGKWK